MKAVVQRVSKASVRVDEKNVGAIQRGFLVLLGVEEADRQIEAKVLAAKIAGLRIFEDENKKMNRSLADLRAGILVISNFTLCADCRKGRRPNFVHAAPPAQAEALYLYFCACLREKQIADVQTGVFGADMQVSLINDGPVTIILDSKELAR